MLIFSTLERAERFFLFLNKSEFGEAKEKEKTETRTVQVLFWENDLGKFT